MICSTLTPNRSGKENPCYTQIRLQKIRILEIRELHNGWLQCGLNDLPPQTSPGTVPNSEPLKIRVTVKTPEGKKKSFFDIISIQDNSKDSPLLHKIDKYTIDKNKAVTSVIPQNENGKLTK